MKCYINVSFILATKVSSKLLAHTKISFLVRALVYQFALGKGGALCPEIDRRPDNYGLTTSALEIHI